LFTQEQMMEKFRKLSGEIEALGDSIDDSEVGSLRDEIDGLKYTLDGIENTIGDWSTNVLDLRNKLDDLMEDVEQSLAGTPRKPITLERYELEKRMFSLHTKQGDFALLAEELRKNPESFWMTLAHCLMERPFDNGGLVLFVREYSKHV
jgi:predicted nuclease with TOPRIM domain